MHNSIIDSTCRLGVRHRRAEEGKGRGEEGKGDGSAVEWDQRGSERKGRGGADTRGPRDSEGEEERRVRA